MCVILFLIMTNYSFASITRMQSCKKINFVWYPDLQLQNVRIMPLVKFTTIWGKSVNISFLLAFSSHFELSCVSGSHFCIIFRESMLGLQLFENYHISSRIVQYPRYHDSELLQLCKNGWKRQVFLFSAKIII